MRAEPALSRNSQLVCRAAEPAEARRRSMRRFAILSRLAEETGVSGVNKTPISKKFAGELVKVNDQLCYSALLHQEFKQTISHSAASAPDEFTSSIFPANPFSERLHRRGSELPTFAEQSRVIGLRMALVFGYEHAAAYLEEIQSFRASVKPTSQDSIHADAVEDQVFQKLERWMPTPPNKGWFKTLGYCRHMRNSFAHAHEQASKEFLSFSANNGHALNKFWKNDKTELFGVDFRTGANEPLDTDMAFAFMNLLRICLKEIDRLFAASFSLEDVLPIVVNQVTEARPDLREFPSKIASKARAIIHADFGERFPTATLNQRIEDLLSERN
jgi:hypothetical protein